MASFFGSDPATWTTWSALPPGFSFEPDEAEITRYLFHKLDGTPNPILAPDLITIEDAYSLIPNKLLLDIDHKPFMKEERLFYTTRSQENTYETSDGYYTVIFEEDDPLVHDNEVIGFKRTLRYYHGTPESPMETEWHVDGYRVNSAVISNQETVTNLVMCKLFCDD